MGTSFGNIDILVNHAGSGVTRKPFEEITTQDWKRTMNQFAILYEDRFTEIGA